MNTILSLSNAIPATNNQAEEQVTHNPAFSILSAIGKASQDEARKELSDLEGRYEQLWLAAGGGTLRTPSTGPTSTTHYLGHMLDQIEDHRKNLGMPSYEHPRVAREVHPVPQTNYIQPSQLIELSREGFPIYVPPTHLHTPPPSHLLAPPPLIRVNAFTDYSAHRRLFEETDEDDLMDRLRTYRSELQLKQDDIYRGCETEEQIQAAQEKSEDMSRKIRALEDCMLSFGAIFRHR